MKRVTVALLIAAAVAAAGAAPPMWARVYYNSYDAAARDILAAGFDVASGSMAEKYIDVVAEPEAVAGLQDLGYRVEVLAEDAGASIAMLPPDLGLYHTYAEMQAELETYAATYPELCALSDVGDTWESRDMWCLKVSDNPTVSEGEPKLFVVGDQHARELMTVEIPLHFIKILLEGYATNNLYKYYVDNTEIYFMPMANPDGHVYVEGHSSGSPNNWWRKNRRFNNPSYGVDINRNYGYMWGYNNNGSSPNPSSETYRGPSAFSEPETTAIRNLMINVPFDYALDYHSYGEYLLFPWGYPSAGQSHTAEHDFFLQLGNGMNGTLGNRFDVGTIAEVLYQVNGGSVDYHYGEQTEKNKIYGFTFEVNTSAQGGFGPNESYIEPTVTEQEGPFFWLLAYMHGVTGVELEAFDAYKRAGAALINWAARCEYNHAGYNLYRAEAGVDRARVKVNGALITGVSPYRFVDEGVEAGKRYAYYLEAVDLSGRTTSYGPARLDMGAAKPAAFALGQNQPNPARGVTRIPVSLAAAGPATLAVYDVAGRCVANVDLGTRPAGAGMVDLDVAAFTPGVYVYRLVAGGDVAARRMVVTR